MKLAQKLNRLKKIILSSESAVIAFSGGVDSTFLLFVASGVLSSDKILAVTANSATYPQQELALAKNIAKAFRVKHKVINTQELKDKKFISNPVNRCYFCKKELFSSLKIIAKKDGLKSVFDASNLSDKKDFRPGAKAKNESGVRSPLQEAGLSKPDIRKLSRKFGLSNWDKPALACLASRIPYGTPITERILHRIDTGEAFLNKIGFKQLRLRDYNGLCRIEVPQKDLCRLILMSKRIVDKMKRLGYNYITLDLEGYRTGSLNEVVKK